MMLKCWCTFAPLATFSSVHVEYERMLCLDQQVFVISDLWPSFIHHLRGPGPFSTSRWTNNPSPTSHHQWGTLWWRAVPRCPCSFSSAVRFSRVCQRHSHEPWGTAQGGRKVAPDASKHLKWLFSDWIFSASTEKHAQLPGGLWGDGGRPHQSYTHSWWWGVTPNPRLPRLTANPLLQSV